MIARGVFGAAALWLAVSGAAMAAEPGPLGPALDMTPREQQEAALGRQPESWFVDHLAGPRRAADGDVLDPKIQFLLEAAAKAPPQTVESEKALFADPARRAAVRGAVDRNWTLRTLITTDMASVEDRKIPGRGGDIPVRIYRPRTSEAGPLPVLVYFHGGGFVFASVAAMDRAVRLIANEARVVVVSVDYRLAPEHPYPAAHDDAEDAYLWARAHAAAFGGDPGKVAVGGDSAGGNLAVVTSMRQIRAGRPAPVYQLLYYPAVSLKTNERSYAAFGAGYNLERPFMQAVTEMTFPKPPAEVSPLEAPSLKGLPATIVATSGFDPLRDQGRRFARRLENSGVSVLYVNYGSLTHGFLNLSGVVGDAEAASKQTAAIFGQAVRSRPAALALAPPGK